MPKCKKDPNSELLAVRIPERLMGRLRTVGGRMPGKFPAFIRGLLRTGVDPCGEEPYLRRVNINQRGYYTHRLAPDREFVTAQVALTDYLGVIEHALRTQR
jgi:hypothetical protein